MAKNAASARKTRAGIAEPPEKAKRPASVAQPAPSAAGEQLSPGPAWPRRHLPALDDFSAAAIEPALDTAHAMQDVPSRQWPPPPWSPPP